MENNTDEQKQHQHDLETASTWLTDAREWAKLAKHLHAETEPLPDNHQAVSNKLNVARACIGNAFQLTYNVLLVAEAKWPRENDSLETSHRRLKNDTQNKIQSYNLNAGCDDTARLLKELQYHRRDYMTRPLQCTPDAHTSQPSSYELQIPSLARLSEELSAFANRKIAGAKNAGMPRQLNPNEALIKILATIQEIV